MQLNCCSQLLLLMHNFPVKSVKIKIINDCSRNIVSDMLCSIVKGFLAFLSQRFIQYLAANRRVLKQLATKRGLASSFFFFFNFFQSVIFYLLTSLPASLFLAPLDKQARYSAQTAILCQLCTQTPRVSYRFFAFYVLKMLLIVTINKRISQRYLNNIQTPSSVCCRYELLLPILSYSVPSL